MPDGLEHITYKYEIDTILIWGVQKSFRDFNI